MKYYAVMLTHKTAAVNVFGVKKNLELTWSGGMIGVLPVFDSEEAAKRYGGGVKVITIEPPRPEKWEPKGGGYFVTGAGDIIAGNSGKSVNISLQTRLYGTERKEMQQAENLRDKIHALAILDAYIVEHAPDWRPDDGEIFYPIYRGRHSEWVAASGASSISPYIPVGPRDVVQRLCDDLNSGRVKL